MLVQSPSLNQTLKTVLRSLAECLYGWDLYGQKLLRTGNRKMVWRLLKYGQMSENLGSDNLGSGLQPTKLVVLDR